MSKHFKTPADFIEERRATIDNANNASCCNNPPELVSGLDGTCSLRCFNQNCVKPNEVTAKNFNYSKLLIRWNKQNK